MFRGIDHIVIACPDPGRAADDLEAELGITATGGGRHEGRGSHNRLVFLADGSYLELIGVTDADLAAGSPVGAATLRALALGGGLATLAIAVDDLESAVTLLAARGAILGPVTHGSRRRDDGGLVEWWTAVPDEPLGPTMPFLIEHAYTGVEWGPAALAQRAEFVHPIGSSVRLRGLAVATADPSAAADGLQAHVGIVVGPDGAELGPHRLRLASPGSEVVRATLSLHANGVSPRTATVGGLRIEVTSGTG
jgi:hypothetical protein